MGNWAPSYFGVGQDVYGKTFLSISTTAQNDPSKYRPLNYTVKISGDISGNCGHINGQYCTGEDFSICDQYGCTVSHYLRSTMQSFLANLHPGRALQWTGDIHPRGRSDIVELILFLTGF